jgi:8-oxo-dGTP pyrophosphatase MutT (NUDIX family)
MRERPSSRLLVLDEANQVLLFRFLFQRGALAGQTYWATPGGALEEGESFEQAALRELWEETGLAVAAVGEPIGDREFVLQLLDGTEVLARDRFFIVHIPRFEVSRAGWTADEREVMAEHRWWSVDQLTSTTDVVFPENLIDLLARAGVEA